MLTTTTRLYVASRGQRRPPVDPGARVVGVAILLALAELVLAVGIYLLARHFS